MLFKKIGIDLGTANILVYSAKKGIVANEPSVVAISTLDGSVLAVGDEAKEMIGRTPDTIVAKRPLRDGVIADYRTTEAMLKYFFSKALGRWKIFRPEVMIAIPGGITSAEKRAVLDASAVAGARATYLIKEPMAAAIGAKIPIGSASGHMIVDMGGGTTEAAIISLGGIVSFRSVRVAGNKFDAAIVDYIRKKYNLAIGEQTAEKIKIKIGAALPLEEKLKMDVKGRDMISGLPKIVTIDSDDITAAIESSLLEIVSAVKKVLYGAPPELSADVMEKGMVLSGGTSLLRKMPQLLTQATGVPAYLAEDPLLAVARGTGFALDNLDVYKKSLFSGA